MALAVSGDVVAAWEPRPGNPFHGRLLVTESGYAFWASDAGWYIVDPDAPAITVVPTATVLRREIRLLGVPLALCALSRGGLSIHGAAVEIDGHAVLLAGPSRAGKTTVAAALARAGHRLLSEDATRCDVGVPGVYPGPALLRLRADVADVVHVPNTVPVESDEDRLHLLIDPRTRGDGGLVPLHSIVFLRPGAERAALRRIPALKALPDVWALAFKLPTDASRAASFGRVSELVHRVQIADLRRPLTMESLPEVISVLERHVRA